MRRARGCRGAGGAAVHRQRRLVSLFAAAYLIYVAWLGLHLVLGVRFRRGANRPVKRVHLLADRIAAAAAALTWAFEDADLAHPFRFSRWTPVHWGFAVVYVLFAAWLGLHLVFGLMSG